MLKYYTNSTNIDNVLNFKFDNYRSIHFNIVFHMTALCNYYMFHMEYPFITSAVFYVSYVHSMSFLHLVQ